MQDSNYAGGKPLVMAAAGKPARVQLIASKQHTAGAPVIVPTFAVLGCLLVMDQPGSILQAERLRIYWLGLATEWLLFAYVRFGLTRRKARTARRIIDESSWSVARWSVYVAIAIGAAFLWMHAASFSPHFLM